MLSVGYPKTGPLQQGNPRVEHKHNNWWRPCPRVFDKAQMFKIRLQSYIIILDEVSPGWCFLTNSTTNSWTSLCGDGWCTFIIDVDSTGVAVHCIELDKFTNRHLLRPDQIWLHIIGWFLTRVVKRLFDEGLVHLNTMNDRNWILVFILCNWINVSLK